VEVAAHLVVLAAVDPLHHQVVRPAVRAPVPRQVLVAARRPALELLVRTGEGDITEVERQLRTLLAKRHQKGLLQ